jgi:hypothetical protein
MKKMMLVVLLSFFSLVLISQEKPPLKPMPITIAKGKIASLDSEQKILSLSTVTPEGKEEVLTIAFDNTLNILGDAELKKTLKKRSFTLSDLKEGASVKVHYKTNEDNSLLAKRIILLSEKEHAPAQSN